MKTPYYLISEDVLKANVNGFKRALQSIWPNSQIAYSVKTNSLPWILEFMNTQDVFLEVVSDEEYDLACLCNTQMGKVIFNGPIKTNTKLVDAIKNKSIVNVDSRSDVNALLNIELENTDNIGVRINVPPELFCAGDVSDVDEGFRFGFAVENGEFEKVLKRLKSHFGNTEFGLHLHCNSITRSVEVYRTIAKYARKIIKDYGLHPPFIDIGGGFFGGIEGKPTPEVYLTCIRNELCDVVDNKKTRLYIEPGSALIGTAVDLYSTVVDIKDTVHSRIVTTDTSRFHLDPLWKKVRYNYSLVSKSDSRIDSQIICGYTCMDHDRLMVLHNEQELRSGDSIIYHWVGAYTMTMGGMFIRYLPEVYVKNSNGIELVRKRITTEDYFFIQASNK